METNSRLHGTVCIALQQLGYISKGSQLSAVSVKIVCCPRTWVFGFSVNCWNDKTISIFITRSIYFANFFSPYILLFLLLFFIWLIMVSIIFCFYGGACNWSNCFFFVFFFVCFVAPPVLIPPTASWTLLHLQMQMF